MSAAEPAKHARIRSSVARSAVSNYLGTGLALCVWFFLTPFMVSRLGKTDYGLWVLITPLAAYGAVLNSGIGSAVTKYVAEYRARGDSDGASAIIATSLWIFFAFGILVLLLGVIFAPLAPHIIRVPARQDHLTSTVVILAALTVAVELPATTAIAVLRSVHRFDLINVIGSLGILTIALAIVVVLSLGGGIVAVTATIAPLPVIWQVPAIWALRRNAPDLRFGFRGASFALARSLTSFTAAIFAIQGAAAIKLETDEVVIGVALPVRAISPYSIARRLSSLPASLAAQFVIVLMPVASELDAQGDSTLLREVFVTGMRCTLGLFGAVAGGLVVFAARFLTVWVGRSFATSADIVLLLTFGGLFEVLLWPATGVLQAMDRHRPLVVFALASAALNLGLSIALIGSLGVRGVAVATLIATAAEALFVVPYATRVLRVGGRALLMRVALPSLIPAIPMVAVLLAVRVAVAPTSIPMIALCGLAGAFVYGACYLAFPAAKTERAAAATLIAGTGALVRRARDRALPPARQPRLPIGTAGARPVPASGWLAEHLHDRLYRTGYYLIVGTGITSLLGVAFWALAAHTYSARDVGLDAAAISAMTLVSGACSLDLTAVFVRYLPIAGDAAHKLVSRSYAVTVALSLIFGLAAALSSSLWSTKLAFLGGGGWLVGFTLATAATTVFTLEDGVLTGLQAARWIPLENSLYSLAKLVLLVCLTGLLPGAGPFVAWNLPLVPVVFVVNYFIFRRLISRRSAPGTLNRREVVAMTASNHGGNLLALAGTLYLPVLVANLAGAASAAYFYVPWLISLSLQLIAINVMASLTVEAALDPSRLRTLARRSLGHSLRLVVPLVVLAAVVAPWGLLAFGHAYSHAGTGLLRWLALAAVPNVVVSLGITVARIEHRGWIVVAVQGVNSAIVITLSALLLHHHGIASVGLAWAASQTLVAAVLFATILRPVLLAPRRSQTPAGAS